MSFVLIAGKIGDAFGHGTVFRTGCIVFTLGSAVAALSNDFSLLLLARGIQGLGSAMLFGTGPACAVPMSARSSGRMETMLS